MFSKKSPFLKIGRYLFIQICKSLLSYFCILYSQKRFQLFSKFVNSKDVRDLKLLVLVHFRILVFEYSQDFVFEYSNMAKNIRIYSHIRIHYDTAILNAKSIIRKFI